MRRAAFCIVSLACFSLPAAADEAQKMAYPPGADSLVSAVGALADAEDKQVGIWRSSKRYQALRAKFVEGLIESKGSEALAGISLDYEGLLCEPRRGYVELAAKQAYLSSTVVELKKTATTAKIDTLTAALITFFKTNSVKVTSSETNLAARKKATFEACKKDFGEYAESYYAHQFTGAEAGLEDFFSPFLALFKTIADVITPVAIAGAKFVDEQDRKKSIQDYLSRKGVKEQIIAAAKVVNADLSASLRRQRLQRVGQFTEQALALSSTSFDATKVVSCQAAFDANGVKKNGGNAHRPSDDFVKCATAGWAVYSDKLAALLKTAEDYDQLADAPPDLKGDKLKSITDRFDAIANGTLPSQSFEEIWRTAVEIVGFAQTVITAASSDNRDKIKKQIDGLVKAL